MRRLCASVLALALCAACTAPEPTANLADQAADAVRDGDFAFIVEADPLSPEEQRLALRLPPGFEAQVFAAEPDIGKPINMAFDAQGRLWVTQSNSYPFAAPEGQGTDRLTILDDTDGDGRADTFTEVADDLNIPIGVVPVSGGAVVYSIPTVYRLFDTDGDDVADERVPLVTGFGYRDTHGMVNNFMRGLDGFIHAGHGFSNTSTATGTDGSQITMTSGNTFRFRPDGSQVGFTTTGRVNPFGFAYDRFGYLYGADCHTVIVTQLIRGADYPHFSKQPTGIGFGPMMMDHYGPTAIAGLAYHTAPQFPAEYQQHFYAGNPVSGRVNRVGMTFDGSSPQAVPKDDFVISEDPWFRPVDVKVGPDGALYIADFYNRIIGHYEVPLDHPGRDRERGRIWRIVYTGDDAEPVPPRTDWNRADEAALIAGLDAPDVQTRMTASDQLFDRFGDTAHEALLNQWDALSPTAQAHTLWVLWRLDRLPLQTLKVAAASPDDALRTHAMRLLLEEPRLDPDQRQLAVTALTDDSPHVRRAAVEALAVDPVPGTLQPLLVMRSSEPEADTHLHYTLRQALRDHLRDSDVLAEVMRMSWSDDDQALLADVMVGVDAPDAGRFLLGYLQNAEIEEDTFVPYLRHAARHIPASEASELVALVEMRYADDLDFQLTLFDALRDGYAQRGAALPNAATRWGRTLATHFIGDAPNTTTHWRHIPAGKADARSPWVTRMLAVEGEPEREVEAVTSRWRSEVLTGTLQSPTFDLPETLRFCIAGHRGAPVNDPQPVGNFIRVRDAASGEVLKEWDAPRTEGCLPVEWRTGNAAGQTVHLEIFDGRDTPGHAWVGAGDFQAPIPSLNGASPADDAQRQAHALTLAADLGMTEALPRIQMLFAHDATDPEVRIAAGQTLLDLAPAQYLGGVAATLADASQPDMVRGALAQALGETNTPDAYAALRTHLTTSPYRVQTQIAETMAGRAAGRSALLDAVDAGQIPAQVLLERGVQERLNAGSRTIQTRYAALTDNLAPLDANLQAIIDARIASFDATTADAELGRTVFAQQCQVCHQMDDGQGGLIGPQLEGIGRWGVALLTEHIIDPNRAVADAFRYSIVTLNDGSTVSGLQRREEGEQIVFANAAGEEITVAQADIAERRTSDFSLMPASFGETIPEANFHHLIAYLLTAQ
ncbi:MAG: hypothetical protein RhofKO_35180 [Rhodothermales bacterium]